MTYMEKNPDVDLADGDGCNQTYLNMSVGTTLVCRSPGASGLIRPWLWVSIMGTLTRDALHKGDAQAEKFKR